MYGIASRPGDDMKSYAGTMYEILNFPECDVKWCMDVSETKWSGGKSQEFNYFPYSLVMTYLIRCDKRLITLLYHLLNISI